MIYLDSNTLVESRQRCWIVVAAKYFKGGCVTSPIGLCPRIDSLVARVCAGYQVSGL